MSDSAKILIGKSNVETFLLPKMANRHGLITGATGTGKTVTLQAIAGALSDMGVPVFMADVKGDLSGMSQTGGGNSKIEDRIKQLGIKDFSYSSSPVIFWDLFGDKGHPIRATVSDMGPLLISRLLELNDVQTGVLTLVFKIADDQSLLLLDLKDLRMMLQNVGDNVEKFRTEYGNVSPATIGTIQRSLLALEEQGADEFFGEPSLDLNEFMRVERGKGVISILSAEKLMESPKLYSTFLLWMLSELFENLPEVGDLERPKMVFFFDEAHLLFDDTPDSLLDKIQQVVRLIRSKGVGIFFVTQNPLDVPEVILGQLGNRVQHALRAYSPRDQKAVSAAASTFRQNPKIKTETAITELGVGEALVSMLDEKGAPNVVERVFIVPPRSRIGPATDGERATTIKTSPVGTRYDKAVDRESAYEILKAKAQRMTDKKEEETEQKGVKKKSGNRQSFGEAIAKSAGRAMASSAGRQIGNALLRGILGALTRKK